RQVYRLHGWEYKAGCVKHPQYAGKFINKYVYDALPKGVAEELKRRLPKNENGNRKAKLHQLLTVDTRNPHLDRQLTALITLIQECQLCVWVSSPACLYVSERAFLGDPLATRTPGPATSQQRKIRTLPVSKAGAGFLRGFGPLNLARWYAHKQGSSGARLPPS